MNLSTLLQALPHYQAVSDLPNPEITKLTSDSRQVEPGTLFVAYHGVNVDSHRYIPHAMANGAAAVISELTDQQLSDHLGNAWTPHQTDRLITVPNGRQAWAYLSAAWYDFPARQLTMVGITGTDGKTTTTNILYHILHVAHQNVSMISSVNAVIGSQVWETGLHTTTPDAATIQRHLAHMVAMETDTCLLEVTSHGLAHHRVTGCEFDLAIVTNITHEHLDAHEGSLANYRAAKAILFESLATAYPKGLPKMAILNGDDWSFDYLKEKLAVTNTPWRGYSLHPHPETHVFAKEITYQPDKTRFTICTQTAASLESLRIDKTEFEVETTLIGDYNVSNCLAAVAAARLWFDLPPAAIQQGIASLQGIPGRMERLDVGQRFIALVDFAHTPNALRRALTVARTLTDGRVIAVFGCAGLRDVEKRTMMGHIAAELADVSIITAEDPRTENLAEIMATTANVMLADGAIEGQTFERIPDRGRAIYRATQLAQPGDVVIALGKGHEQSMCFGDTEYPWDDRDAMRSALQGQPLLTLPTA